MKILSIVCVYYPEDINKSFLFWRRISKFSKVLLVINGLKDFKLSDEFEVLDEGYNLGVLPAYNLAIKKFNEYDYYWLWDQDTQLSEIELEKFINLAKIAFCDAKVIGVTTADRRNFRNPIKKNSLLCKGSTTLINNKRAQKLVSYFFDEALFVDHGDWDFSYRIYANGGAIKELKGVRYEHNLGTPELTVLGRINRPSLERVTLQGINTIYLLKKYKQINYLTLLLLLRTIIVFPVKSLLFKDRFKRLRNYYLGLIKGFFGETSKDYAEKFLKKIEK